MEDAFPERIRALPAFDGPFDAHRLAAEGCQVLFARYPAGTRIEPHEHASENVGVITRGELHLFSAAGERRYGPGDWYHVPPGDRHWAYFPSDTSEIEFWFEPISNQSID